MDVRPIVGLGAAGLALVVSVACQSGDNPLPGSVGPNTRTASATAAVQARPKASVTATPEPAPTVAPTNAHEPVPTAPPTVALEPTAVANPTATPVPAAGSGIQGQALMGPMCPVFRSDEPCPDRPVQSTVDVWNVDRTQKITSFTTDADGRFLVPLPPGEYLLDPKPAGPNGFPFGKPQTVVVRENVYTAITISYDTGIR